MGDEKFTKASGHDGKAFVCGKCGRTALEAAAGVVKAKWIICPYCQFMIPNKRVGE